MELSADQIERVVREVMRRLETAASTGSAPSGSTSRNEPDKRTLHIPLPVVSTERLAGRLAGIKQVVVPAGAIVTPAAKDLLKDKQVKLIRGQAQPVANGATPSLVVGVANTTFKAAAFFYEMQAEGISIEELSHTGLASVVEELSDQVTRGGRLGLLLTQSVPAAVCLANRNQGVRAAEARCANTTREAVRTLGINLLIVNPVGKSLFELKRMLSVHLAGGGNCPAEWQDHLS